MKNNEKKPLLTIGVLGGMGTYATIHFFERFAEVFPAKKEWERPRIIIDNRCTMPSRVRAFLYNENKDRLILEMAESMNGMLEMGCNKIILACNTSHLFLPYIVERNPKLQPFIVNMINICVDSVEQNITEKEQVFLLGTEGTIESNVYQDALREKRRQCVVPKKDEYYLLRECIEAVKQNKYSSAVREVFLELINRYDNCILGCTELPVLYDMYKDEIICKRVFDPGFLTLDYIHSKFF